MIDIIKGWFAYFLVTFPTSAAINGVFFLMILVVLRRIINSEKNNLEWAHLISTKAADGNAYADWNKIGQGMGVIVSTWMPFYYVNTDKMDAAGLSLVMGVSLTYLGAVSAYSKSLRVKHPTETAGTKE